MIKIIAIIALSALTGCSASLTPCTYHGKAVTQHDANQMKAIGMTVTCPGDEQ